MDPNFFTPELSKEQNDAVEELLKGYASKTSILINLPSLGKFYTDKGPYQIRPLVFEDEQAFASDRKNKINSINTMISRCTTNINMNELLLMDKIFLMFKIREISYGNDYKVKIICPNCGEINECQVDTSKLPVNQISDTIIDPRKVLLPEGNLTFEVRYPKGQELDLILEEELFINNIWRFILNINGQKDKAVIAKVIKSLSTKDSNLLIKAINTPEFGLDSKFMFSCFHCGNKEVLEVPVSTDFFTHQ